MLECSWVQRLVPSQISKQMIWQIWKLAEILRVKKMFVFEILSSIPGGVLNLYWWSNPKLNRKYFRKTFLSLNMIKPLEFAILEDNTGQLTGIGISIG